MDYRKEVTNRPEMEYYRHVYKDSPVWDGKASLADKKIVVYCQQGYGDIIQMARYFKYLKPAHVILHCPQALCRLLASTADELIPKEEAGLPKHDFHILSLELPLMFPDPGNGSYLTAEPLDLEVDGFKIGIAWEGNPNHPRNKDRSCPLRYFKKLAERGSLFMLQVQQGDPSLVDGCEDMDILGVEMGDFQDTARLVAAMDFIVSVDTSLLHLAGALGKRGFGILDFYHDRRWTIRKWYDSIQMWRQPQPGDWQGLFDNLPPITEG